MQFPKNLAERVELFVQNREDYEGPNYREDEVRREFINPLFEALGWDVRNTRGYAEAYKDVVTELPTRVGSSMRAPDYAFRVGGSEKFLVEAKRPSVRIRESASAAFQLRRYAFTMGLGLSVLTDFAEFAVYDTRIRPNDGDPASRARVKYFTCEEFETEWEWLSGTLSVDAVMRGSFDRYANSKGKGSQRGREGVDRSFLDDMESWRSLLAQDIASRNDSLSAPELNLLVTRILDRVIFLRIAEDRGNEPYGQLKDCLRTRRKSYYSEVFNLFERADDRYNSGLFHFRKEVGRSSHPDLDSKQLDVGNDVLRSLIEGLYFPLSPYEFSVMPPEILGRVYEKFLGKSIEVSPSRVVNIVDKPDVRLSGGIFYTPEYVIQYIAENTLTRALSGKSVEAVSGRSSSRRPFTVVDPSCGSGSFLLGAYEAILKWYHQEYSAEPQRHARGRPPRLFQDQRGQWRLTLAERKRILLAHIHGVDKDAQAVETTKLSLLLKVLEGEFEQLSQRQLQVLQERVLPDLDANIRCGNSLIEPDIFVDAPAVEIERISNEVNPFSWHDEFPQIMKSGGFDVVVGNPPYVRIQRIPHADSDYLFRKYSTAAGKTDLSVIFIERALQITRSDGVVGYICTSQWTATDYGRNTRELLGPRLREALNFGSLPVFEDAETYPAIYTFGNAPSDETVLKEISDVADLRIEALRSAPSRIVPAHRLGVEPWNLQPFDLMQHLAAMNIEAPQLRTVAQAAVGDLTGLDDAFVLDSAQADMLSCDIVIPYGSRGADVHAWLDSDVTRWVIFPYDIVDRELRLISEPDLKRRYPKVHKHLLQYRDRLERRQDSRRLYANGPDWYRHLRAGTADLVSRPKLVCKGIDRRSTFGFLNAGSAFNGANTPAMPLPGGTELERDALIGVLNSKLIGYYLRGVCPPKLGGYTRFTSTGINNIPLCIPSTVESGRASAAELVAKRAAAVREAVVKASPRTDVREQDRVVAQRQLRALDKALDTAVYRLYQVAEEDISIVEEAIPNRF